MSTITIPAELKAAFVGLQSALICDENGNTIGYFSTRREATDEDYEWAFKNITKGQIEASLASGPGRPANEIIAELRSKYGL